MEFLSTEIRPLVTHNNSAESQITVLPVDTTLSVLELSGASSFASIMICKGDLIPGAMPFVPTKYNQFLIFCENHLGNKDDP